MTDDSIVYFYLIPVIVFGPVFLWVLYNFGLKDLFKVSEKARLQQEKEKADVALLENLRLRKHGSTRLVMSRGPNRTPLGFFFQALVFTCFAALIGFFASSPSYQFKDPQTGLLKLSLSHAGQRKVPCNQRLARDLAKLEPNMRAKLNCPRERWPVHIEVRLDDKPLYNMSAKPAGLSADGPSTFYQTTPIPAGTYKLTLRLRDNAETTFPYQATQTLTISPRQIVAIQFSAEKGGFIVN